MPSLKPAWRKGVFLPFAYAEARKPSCLCCVFAGFSLSENDRQQKETMFAGGESPKEEVLL